MHSLSLYMACVEVASAPQGSGIDEESVTQDNCSWSEMSQKGAKEGPRLSKNQRLSEHFIIRCCPPFTFLNSKRELVDRRYSLCRSGCFYERQEEDWVCCACQRASRRAKSPARPKPPPAEPRPPARSPPPAKPRSPARSPPPAKPRPRAELRPPPAKPRPAQAKAPPRGAARFR
ncbi:myelin-associated oligodendrocyte basic protein [Heterocephalus glaber]|uniref:Myelin-associated oligodendrocyte basic protein n=1 Tax=Heterocephalus glaber TaxID=10181 RepID=A0AAX6SVB3_HETGA|nr:myelin-associated oligodendrocyte basic protein [Heterocephalus glaber]